MQRSEPENNLPQRLARTIYTLSGVLMAFWMTGCGGGTTASAPAASQQAPQNYFAPYIQGNTFSNPKIYILDDVENTFSQEIFALNLPSIIGPQVLNAGHFTVGQRGLRSLSIWTTYAPDSNGNNVPIPYTTPLTGSFAVELPDQSGGLIQMVGQAFEPIVAATQCPGPTSQTYHFLTIPQYTGDWDGTTAAAYGSVDIASSGNTVNFQNIQQYTLPPPGGGTGTLLPPSTSPVTGECGPTTLGAITGVPGQYIVADPGVVPVVPPQAAIAIGTNGLLVEDNGGENALGTGNGSIGLLKPSSPLDTGKVLGAQYLGFIFGAGALDSFGSIVAPISSHLASFGFSTTPQPSCSSFAAETGTLTNGIYGGDFPQNGGNDNPSASPDGFGNCDFAIDLGAPDPTSNNGLYPNATVWIGGSAGNGYVSNITGGTYHFSAVAIAGQLNGKYAIFVIGADATQPWGVYLLQSN